MKYDNLHNVCKDEKTKKKLMKNYLKINSKIDDKSMAKIFDTSI
jgi:hypothetical protein